MLNYYLKYSDLLDFFVYICALISALPTKTVKVVNTVAVAGGGAR